jgi:signal peptidase I
VNDLIINLALILTVLTLLTGIVVALDKLIWKTEEDDSRQAAPSALRTLVEYSRSFFPVLLFVLVIRSFIFEPFRIPSGSMMPTLLEGDFIFVKKYSYGLRLPVTETKVIETGEPKRGDVIVFRLPSDPSINYIKRVIGLPGDTVVYERHRLTIGVFDARQYLRRS